MMRIVPAAVAVGLLAAAWAAYHTPLARLSLPVPIYCG